MRYLRRFNETDQFDILNDSVKDLLPKTLSVYTSNGTYTFDKDTITREIDILRICYSHNTMNDYNGDDLVDGEPDTLELDMHFMGSNKGLKIAVDITYGDSMVSEFTIETPNKINVGHYNGIDSVADPETHFGFEDDSLQDLCRFFNKFGFKLAPKDFTFIDKHPESYVREDVKLTPLSGGEYVMVVNNDEASRNKYLKDLTALLKMRGIEYLIATTPQDVERINSQEKIIGAILTGSEHRITNPNSDKEGVASKKALEILDCPILGICFGFQMMAKLAGAEVKSTGKHNLTHTKISKYDMHPLFDGINMKTIDFSFDFNDFVVNCPSGYKVIGEVGSYIVAVANDSQKRYGTLFHPEDTERTWKVIDNFTKMFHHAQEEQDNIQSGKFQHIKSFESVAEASSRESTTRTKSISEEEFLDILRENCNNFSFENDILWRNSGGDFGDFGLFLEKERRQTIGKYSYKTFFDLRKGYPVPRYKSLIGSSSREGADFLGSGSKNFIVIPFDNSQIVFAGSPDLALWSKVDQEFTDDLFVMTQYGENFKVPNYKLSAIRSSSKLGTFKKAKEYGFEFFTTSPCLLLHESKIDWLKSML